MIIMIVFKHFFKILITFLIKTPLCIMQKLVQYIHYFHILSVFIILAN